MNVGVVYHGRFPWNRGIGQLCELIRSIGHSAFVIAPPGDAAVPSDEIPVASIPPGATPHGRVPPGASSPLNPQWRRWIETYVRELDIGALVVRETVLAHWAIGAARRVGIPVYLDMRENLAAMYAAGRAKNPLLRPFRSRRFVRWFESRQIPRFDHVFTVSPELEEWVVSCYSLDAGRVSVLANYPDDTFLNLAARALETRARSDRPRILVYAGYIRESRGIQDVIAALPIVARGFPDIRFRIIGTGDYSEELKSIAHRLGVADLVEFRAMLPPGDVPGALAECHVGVSCYHLTEQAHQTVPGKLFEYMAVGLPILSSGRRSVKRITGNVDCGLVYESSEPQSIASLIGSLLSNPREASEMGERGRRAVLEYYNWKRNVQALAAVLGRGSAGNPGGGKDG